LGILAAVPVAFAAGGGGLWWRWWDAPASAELRVLAHDEWEFLQAFAEAWMPPGGTPAISGAEALVGTAVDGMLEPAPDRERKLLKLLLQALDDLPMFTHGACFRELALAERTSLLKQWRDSSLGSLRQATEALLMLVGEAYAAHPEVRAEWRTLSACGR